MEYNASHIELPSGRLVKSNVKEVRSINESETQYIFQVIYDNGSTEIFSYDDNFIGRNDKRIITKYVKS